MKEIKVNLKHSPYKIIVGNNILDDIGSFAGGINIGKQAYVITNSLVMSKCGRPMSRGFKKAGFSVRIKLIADTEKSKSFQTAEKLIGDIAEFSLDRSIFIVAFGGGVVGDLAGFVAAIYKRGVPYIQVPTTMLAQIDSSIGGKTAVDLNMGKNLVGAFYQPRLVLCDVALLKSLSKRQISSGMAEAIKYAVIKDKALFEFLEKNCREILARDKDALEFVVSRCASIKAGIVGQDEKEKKGIRTILNFGHTLGHAIETAGKYKNYNHGEAVALGMLAANHIGMNLGLIKPEQCVRIKQLIIKAGLPSAIGKQDHRLIIKAHYYDKKFQGKVNRFVLLSGIGKAIVKKNIPLSLIKESLNSITK